MFPPRQWVAKVYRKHDRCRLRRTCRLAKKSGSGKVDRRHDPHDPQVWPHAAAYRFSKNFFKASAAASREESGAAFFEPCGRPAGLALSALRACMATEPVERP